MIGITQLFIVFVLVFIIAYLVGMGIDYSTRQEFKMTSVESSPQLLAVPDAVQLSSNQPPVLTAAKDVADALAKTTDAAIHGKGEELKEYIEKYGELRHGDLVANEAAVEEFGNRLREKLYNIEDSEARKNYSEKIDSIEEELTN